MNLVLVNADYSVVSIPPILRNDYINALSVSRCLNGMEPRLFIVLAGQIMSYHQPDQLLKAGLCRIPAQFSFRLARISPKVDNIRRTIEFFRYLYDHLFGRPIDAGLVKALAAKFQLYTSLAERILAKFPHRMLLSGRNDKVLRPLMLDRKSVV